MVKNVTWIKLIILFMICVILILCFSQFQASRDNVQLRELIIKQAGQNHLQQTQIDKLLQSGKLNIMSKTRVLEKDVESINLDLNRVKSEIVTLKDENSKLKKLMLEQSTKTQDELSNIKDSLLNQKNNEKVL